MRYRPEIDGLRTVAVIPVILFHGGFKVFSGGFVGVDIFFVISGYLITGILIAELQRGDFSIIRFYERRARRILPALFVVMACCIPFAWMWMLPSQFKDFSQSVVAVVFFSSNMLFWQESGYFGAAAELKPLLHTWSLAVEEQYYVFFPVFLALAWRFGRSRVFWIIVAFAAASLALSEWGWRHWPSGNFFLAPTRAWELLAGSLCAFATAGREPGRNDWLSAAGLAMIVLAIFAYDETTPFPSLYSLLPVGGAALIILFGGAGTRVARLLSTPPFVGIGLISYSAYLWHQPIFAFARLRNVTETADWMMGLLAVLSLLLAWLSWRFVEQPFRRKPVPLLRFRARIFSASALGAVLFMAIGLFGHVSQGAAWRLPDDILAVAKAEDDRAGGHCQYGTETGLPPHPKDNCQHPDSAGRTDVMLLGDSHSRALSRELGKLLRQDDIGFYEISFSACVPLPGFVGLDSPKPHLCSDLVKGALDYARSAGIGTIVLAGRYTLYWDGRRYDNQEGGVEPGDHPYIDTDAFAGEAAALDSPERRQRVLNAYAHTITDLADAFRVVLVYPIPEAGWNVPQTAVKERLFNGTSADITTSYDAFLERNDPVLDAFDSVASRNVFKVRPHEYLCHEDTRRCDNTRAGRVLYYDDDHLSNTGARIVVPAILDAIEKALGRNSGKTARIVTSASPATAQARSIAGAQP